jgi:hypothetical protein
MAIWHNLRNIRILTPDKTKNMRRINYLKPPILKGSKFNTERLPKQISGQQINFKSVFWDNGGKNAIS